MEREGQSFSKGDDSKNSFDFQRRQVTSTDNGDHAVLPKLRVHFWPGQTGCMSKYVNDELKWPEKKLYD